MVTAVKGKRISDEALSVLSEGVVDGKTFAITNGQLDRKLYVEVNGVLESMGGKWNRKLRVHVFGEDPADSFAESGTGVHTVMVTLDK